MGKTRHRIFNRYKSYGNLVMMSRSQVVGDACRTLLSNPCSHAAKNLINMFGLTTDELSECGINLESLRPVRSMMI